MAYRRDYVTEVAPRRPGGLAEQRRPRRDFLTERIIRLDPDALYERAIPLPADIPLERLLNHFVSAWYCDYLDRTEPGWDERLTGRRY